MPAPEGIHTWTFTTNVSGDFPASDEVKTELSKVLDATKDSYWTFTGTNDELRSLIQGVANTTHSAFDLLYDTPLKGQPPQGSHWRESGVVHPDEDDKEELRSLED